MSFEIVTDSSSNLTDELIEKFNLHILSLMFRVSEKEYYSYEKGKKTELKQFYTMMRNKEEITTTLIDINVCTPIFEDILKQGNDILYIGFSSALSGTYQAAAMVLEDLKSAYPDRTILFVDTLGASMGEGLLVYHAAKLREQGKSINDVYNWVLENRLHLCHWFTVDDLFFLKRGGRVSASSAVLGTILGVKPIMHMDNEGRLILVEKARGRKRSLDTLVDHMQKTAIEPHNQTIFITHGDCIEDAEYVAGQVKKRFNVKDVLINYVDPVIGAHSGPGTIALFFLGTER